MHPSVFLQFSTLRVSFLNISVISYDGDCEFSQMLHVGDSLKNDVAGAQSVGAWTVWLNRDGVPNDTQIQPDYEVVSLSEIPEILRLKR